jgi:Arc/MetJ-type ribon-helix-helix transcriptional regulator
MTTMPKAKITITVERKLLDWADKQVETYRFRNRSHIFEYALVKLMQEKDSSK